LGGDNVNERERKIKVYVEVDMAHNLVAGIWERHHHDGDFAVDSRPLKELVDGLYRWRKRLETELYGPAD
jgi:hypothetical protein